MHRRRQARRGASDSRRAEADAGSAWCSCWAATPASSPPTPPRLIDEFLAEAGGKGCEVPRNARGAVSRAPHPPGGGETSVAPFLRRLGRAGLVCPTALDVAFTHQTGPQEDRVLTVDERSIPLMLNIVYPMWAQLRRPAGNRVPGGHQLQGLPVGQFGPTPGSSSPPTTGRRRRGSHPGWPPSDLRRQAPPSGRAHRLRSPLRSRHRRGGRPHRPVAAASPSGPPAYQTTGDSTHTAHSPDPRLGDARTACVVRRRGAGVRACWFGAGWMAG